MLMNVKIAQIIYSMSVVASTSKHGIRHFSIDYEKP